MSSNASHSVVHASAYFPSSLRVTFSYWYCWYLSIIICLALRHYAQRTCARHKRETRVCYLLSRFWVMLHLSPLIIGFSVHLLPITIAFFVHMIYFSLGIIHMLNVCPHACRALKWARHGDAGGSESGASGIRRNDNARQGMVVGAETIREQYILRCSWTLPREDLDMLSCVKLRVSKVISSIEGMLFINGDFKFSKEI